MFSKKSKLLTLAALLFGASFAIAQDNKALIDVLIQKGILNQEEAAKIQKDLAKNAAATEVSTSGSKNLVKLTLSGRFQAQFADLGTNISGAATEPAATQHFLMRRMYLGAKAEMGNGWSGNLNYDFANASFDACFIQWKQSDLMVLDIGFRKAPIGLEEWDTSSGSLKAIERSPATRYFVESNNGRRLGAGSYRTGVFLGGTDASGFFYNIAVTNPERDEFSSLNGNSDPGVQGSGSAANNNFAYWGNAGYKGKFTGGTYRFGASVGYLPDQGGLVLGKGNNLTVYSLYGVVTSGNFDLEGEYFDGNDKNGVSAVQDAKPKAFWIQPSYKLTDNLEATVRYTEVYAGQRGVNLSDGIRSAPSGGAMKHMNESYFGLTWFFRGNDTKLQVGYIHGESKDTVLGAPASAKTDGIRSQVQVNF
jgi:hypothetical protein